MLFVFEISNYIYWDFGVTLVLVGIFCNFYVFWKRFCKLKAVVRNILEKYAPEETYALLDSIESDCEEDIDNLMTDSDTEFIVSLLHEDRVSHKTLNMQRKPIQ